MASTRYRVFEKSGGLGEVVQVTVRDVGVNTGENTPALFVSPLRDTAASTGGRLFCPYNEAACAACAHRQQRMQRLEARVAQLEQQLRVNDILGALMSSMEVQRTAPRKDGGARRSRSSRSRFSPEQKAEAEASNETLLEMMQEELKRQDLLHALMDLMERPTHAERMEIMKPVPKTAVKLLFTPPKKASSGAVAKSTM
ncbi:hypothetical protein TraAM80_05020 [Trypanosoma rangeli]|uniref:Uncharacterized protein n=1 Tax=Trypanosoma rangeli TaxID=5698 RepID=A0A3R7LWB7_TRYRA|nr:uncharacterized protein TraAM80_05020 [Trypanosoma rangeli]RNF04617.1 hypothetical protein TraAM80_05020 [Trypanosoma rangeli]|eukprot:RNF04617.1 hypothetical protein TraAM80_05020 [Trypanosoma rangeli]